MKEKSVENNATNVFQTDRMLGMVGSFLAMLGRVCAFGS